MGAYPSGFGGRASNIDEILHLLVFERELCEGVGVRAGCRVVEGGVFVEGGRGLGGGPCKLHALSSNQRRIHADHTIAFALSICIEPIQHMLQTDVTVALDGVTQRQWKFEL